MEINLVKHVINEAKFGQNRTFLVKMVKMGSFWGPQLRHMLKFWKIGPIIFALNVSKNYFSQFYGQKSGQKCH